jgi:uncharacterized membrane protein (DUF2068 family)
MMMKRRNDLTIRDADGHSILDSQPRRSRWAIYLFAAVILAYGILRGIEQWSGRP